ncbi:hypothetical protein KC340_g12879 [Hortaea werneckii]|nr:hypothetical protein KC339_g614 [Hortaea werneckii]KAI7241834.1 hypothetical protein KC365_g3372 [Hortaea werneckii]KAI7301976.1 hypothetical protein KC340_g12879 [Hortaea werneckii]KAI7404647.1 hypothetical protein KC328_g1836 [Hortaea werneckii]
MSSHTIHYMPVGNDGNYGVYAPIGPYPPPQWVVPPPQPQPWQVPAPMLPPHLCAPPPTTSGPAPPPAAPQGTESPSRKRKASPAQPRLPASDPRLTREQHLVALRIQLSEDLRYKYDCDGYWTEVTRRAGREFEEWLGSGQTSKTAGKCEDELTLARREWACLRAYHDQLPPMEKNMRHKAQGEILAWERDVGAARLAEAEQQERKRLRYTCEDPPADRKVPDCMGGGEWISVLASDEDDRSLDATSAGESDEDIPTESDGGLLPMPPPSDSDRSSSVSEPRRHDAVTKSFLQTNQILIAWLEQHKTETSDLSRMNARLENKVDQLTNKLTRMEALLNHVITHVNPQRPDPSNVLENPQVTALGTKEANC